MHRDTRFVAFAAVQAAVLGAVAGTVAGMTVFVPIDTAGSGPAAVAATWLVRVLLVLVGASLLVALVLPGPEDRAVGSAEGASRVAGAAATGAVVVLAAALAGLLLVALLTALGGNGFLSAVAALCAVGVCVLGGARLTGRRPLGARETPFSTGRVLALVGAFALAFVLAPGFLVTPTEHVALYGADVPESDFEFQYESVGEGWGVVTVTHAGGEPADPESLTLGYRGVNESYPDVEGVDQYEPGAWAGEATGPPVDDGASAAVVEGDSVRVAVRSDCSVALLHAGARQTALGHFGCPGHEPGRPTTPSP